MELINENSVKKMISEQNIMPRGEFCVDESQLFTPSAIEYLNDKNIRITKKSTKLQETNDKNYNTMFGGVMINKPEHMTHIKGNTLVFKDHPIIKYRGALDYLESEIIVAQIIAKNNGYTSIINDLEGFIALVRKLIRFEITGEKLNNFTLINLNAEQLREHSHHTTKHYGISHFLPSYEHGEVVATLNKLRTITRKTELIAYDAFKDQYGNTDRDDLIVALNRMSSAFWIMMCKLIKGLYKKD